MKYLALALALVALAACAMNSPLATVNVLSTRQVMIADDNSTIRGGSQADAMSVSGLPGM